MEFHDIIKTSALEFARKNAIVMPGEIVETTWCGRWKKPHKVQIYQVGACLSHDDFDTQKREFKAVLEMCYYALRLKADGTPKDTPGCGIVLQHFVAADGREWSQSQNVVNNAAVHWSLPESWPYVPESVLTSQST